MDQNPYKAAVGDEYAGLRWSSRRWAAISLIGAATTVVTLWVDVFLELDALAATAGVAVVLATFVALGLGFFGGAIVGIGGFIFWIIARRRESSGHSS